MTRALVVHPGTQHVFQLASELNRLDSLAGLHTGFAVGRGGAWERMIDAPLFPFRRLISNRIAKGVPTKLLHCQIGLEMSSQLRSRVWRAGQAHYHWRNECFQRAIPDRALAEADVVIGFDTSSWILAERCRELGSPLILVQTTIHPDEKIAIEDRIMRDFPYWSSSIETRLPNVRKAEQIEHDVADLVVTSSSFTARTLTKNGVGAEKIRVNFHGVDVTRFVPKQGEGQQPVRFVFLGSVTASKGVPLLLEAWRRLRPGSAEMWLVGPVADHIRPLLGSQQGLRIIGAVPHVEIPRLLHQCDVLLFPSYFEGFGLVILEAMACGLPVIATDATAAPDIYSDDEGGWIVPVGDVEVLAARLDHCLANPARTRDMGRVARRIAEQLTWAAFGERWLGILAGLHKLHS